MKEDTIILHPNALEGILISVQETITKSESYGTLYGKFREKSKTSIRWTVEFVLPNQLVRRCQQSVWYYRKKDVERAELAEFENKAIGIFHSHIPIKEYFGLAKLSKDDIKDMDHNRIDLVIGIKKVKKEGIIKEDPFTISWYTQDNSQIYRADMKGYYLNEKVHHARFENYKRIFKMIR